MKRIYIIGGSPCSGKSTVTKTLSEKHDLFYFKVDDYLDKYTKRGAKEGYPMCTTMASRTAEETWMREPKQMCKEEIQYYEEIFDFILEDLMSIQTNKDIITEGAAFMPHLIEKITSFDTKYMAIIPSPEFQIEHYKKREWVDFVLKDCIDKEKAFSNWMQRDILFAKEVEKECKAWDYRCVLNDGSLGVDELLMKVLKDLDMINKEKKNV